MSRELSKSDKDILEKEGVKLFNGRKGSSRKRKQHKTLEASVSSSSSQHYAGVTGHSGEKTEETKDGKWLELKKYLDPNPQLNGWSKGRLQPKVSIVRLYNIIFRG